MQRFLSPSKLVQRDSGPVFVKNSFAALIASGRPFIQLPVQSFFSAVPFFQPMTKSCFPPLSFLRKRSRFGIPFPLDPSRNANQNHTFTSDLHRAKKANYWLSLSRTNRIAASHARQPVYRSYALTIRTDIDPDSYFFCFTKALFGHRDAGCAGNRLGVHLLTAHLMAAGIAERSALDPPEDASNVSRVLLRQSFHFFLSVTGRTGNFTNLQRPKRQGHRKICAPVFLA